MDKGTRVILKSSRFNLSPTEPYTAIVLGVSEELPASNDKYDVELTQANGMSYNMVVYEWEMEAH